MLWCFGKILERRDKNQEKSLMSNWKITNLLKKSKKGKSVSQITLLNNANSDTIIQSNCLANVVFTLPSHGRQGGTPEDLWPPATQGGSPARSPWPDIWTAVDIYVNSGWVCGLAAAGSWKAQIKRELRIPLDLFHFQCRTNADDRSSKDTRRRFMSGTMSGDHGGGFLFFWKNFLEK